MHCLGFFATMLVMQNNHIPNRAKNVFVGPIGYLTGWLWRDMLMKLIVQLEGPSLFGTQSPIKILGILILCSVAATKIMHWFVVHEQSRRERGAAMHVLATAMESGNVDSAGIDAQATGNTENKPLLVRTGSLYNIKKMGSLCNLKYGSARWQNWLAAINKSTAASLAVPVGCIWRKSLDWGFTISTGLDYTGRLGLLTLKV